MQTLINGDCLEIMQDLATKGIKIDTFIIDPPYSQTACGWDKAIPLAEMWSCVKALRKETSNIIVFSKQPYTTILNNSNLEEYRYEIIWEKQQATNPMCAKKRIMPIHENISVFYKKLGTYNPQMRMGHSNYSGFCDMDKKIGEIYNLGSKHRECSDGSRYPISVVRYKNVRKGLHPTQKPLELVSFLVKTYSNENDLVMDFCMGSGTTGLACKLLNRNFVGIELDKKYFSIAKERIEREKSKKMLDIFEQKC